MNRKPWTHEQRDNAIRYGACRECGAPRQPEITQGYDDDGRLIVRRGLVCENGHELSRPMTGEE